jgi:hypothetical protein
LRILLIGPYFGNKGHAAENGVYDAIRKCGHKCYVYDNRTKQILWLDGKIENIDLEKHNGSTELFDTIDLTIVCGPGFTQNMIKSGLPKIMRGVKVLWNSEPIRLSSYRERLCLNKELFDFFFTFDKTEVPIYQQLGFKNVFFLPQGYNPKWYKPLHQKPQHDLCFIGSIGGKWGNRIHFLQRIQETFGSLHVLKPVFDGEYVNKVYNDHKIVLNIGLWIPELGAVEELKASGYQQRIFEAYGSGRVCVTHEEEEYPEFLIHKKNVIFYNKNNLEEMISYALRNWDALSKNILANPNKHTYEARIKQMFINS